MSDLFEIPKPGLLICIGYVSGFRTNVLFGTGRTDIVL